MFNIGARITRFCILICLAWFALGCLTWIQELSFDSLNPFQKSGYTIGCAVSGITAVLSFVLAFFNLVIDFTDGPSKKQQKEQPNE